MPPEPSWITLLYAHSCVKTLTLSMGTSMDKLTYNQEEKSKDIEAQFREMKERSHKVVQELKVWARKIKGEMEIMRKENGALNKKTSESEENKHAKT